MFSHVVIFWTKTNQPNAADALVAGAEKYLRNIPGVRSFHVGRMVRSDRDVVDQSYQVALHLQFDSKQAQDDYQAHPEHLEFVEKSFKTNCERVVIYDFE
ncbi:MAG: Dabb family protein [Chthoniobacteraceae bacterium]